MSFLLALLTTAFAAPPDAATLEAAWRSSEAVRRAKGLVEAPLTAAEFEKIAKGDVARRVFDAGENLAAIGAIWSDHPVEWIWLAIQDPEHMPIAKEDMPLVRLPGDTPLKRLNYQVVKTPWPLSNRQMVFTVTANQAIWAASDHEVWERAIKLDDPAKATASDPSFVWIEKLGGGFVIQRIGDGCLIVLRAEADPGGSIPADFVTRLSTITLGRSLKKLLEVAATVPGHYVAGHPPILWPDGTVITPGSL